MCGVFSKYPFLEGEDGFLSREENAATHKIQQLWFSQMSRVAKGKTCDTLLRHKHASASRLCVAVSKVFIFKKYINI